MSETRTVRCVCGLLYKIYPHYAGDQTKCPECRAAERRELEEQQKERNR